MPWIDEAVASTLYWIIALVETDEKQMTNVHVNKPITAYTVVPIILGVRVFNWWTHGVRDDGGMKIT